MNEAIENAKAVLFSGTLDSDRLRGALSVLLDDAEALERQRDAVLGDEGRELVKQSRRYAGAGAPRAGDTLICQLADFIERQAAAVAALRQIPEDLVGLTRKLDGWADGTADLDSADLAMAAQAIRAMAALEAAVERDAVLGDDASTVHAVRALADQLDRHDHPDDAETCRDAAGLIERQAAVIAAQDEEALDAIKERGLMVDRHWAQVAEYEARARREIEDGALRMDRRFSLEPLQQMPEDLAGLCERLDGYTRMTLWDGPGYRNEPDPTTQRAAQVIRAMVAREAAVRRDVDALISATNESEPHGQTYIYALRDTLAILSRAATGEGREVEPRDEAVDRARAAIMGLRWPLAIDCSACQQTGSVEGCRCREYAEAAIAAHFGRRVLRERDDG